jgi:hypothetical protein
MADAIHIPNETETRARFVIPAQAGIQTGPLFGGFAASFVKGLGPDLRRDDGVYRCDGGANG